MKRNVIILSVLAFFVNLGFGAVMPLLPFLLLSYEGKLTDLPENLGKIPAASEIALQMTILMSAFMITRAFLAAYFGNLSDKVGRKKIISIGLALYTVISIGYALSTNWIELLFVRAVQGVASAMVWPVAEAMLTDSVLWSERGRYMGWYMTASNISFFIGPTFGAYLYKVAVIVFNFGLPFSLVFPFYVLALLSLVGFILNFFAVETIIGERRVGIREALRNSINDSFNSTIELPSEVSRSIKVIYVMGLANGVAMGLVAPITSIFVIQYITSDPAAIGYLSTIAGFVGFLVNYPAGYISDIVGRKKIVILAQLMTRTVTFLMPFTKKYGDLVLLYSTRAAAFNMMSPAYRALQADLVPKKLRGRVFGTVQSLFNVGAASAPIGGYIYQISAKWSFNILGYIVPGVAVSFWLSAAIGIFTTILFILFVIEPTRELKERISK